MPPRRVFTEEFKRDAVRLVKERGNVAEVARDLGVHESVLTRWKKRLDAAPERPFPGKGNPQDLELAHDPRRFHVKKLVCKKRYFPYRTHRRLRLW